ncbi:MAG: hypothetical protein AABX29_07355 [Nanoarchaeota archaeon]
MKLTEIIANSKDIGELKKQINSLEKYNLTSREIKIIDKKILKNLEREQVLDILVILGNWYCAYNSHEDWKKIKSKLLKDEEVSEKTRDYLAVID